LTQGLFAAALKGANGGFCRAGRALPATLDRRVELDRQEFAPFALWDVNKLRDKRVFPGLFSGKIYESTALSPAVRWLPET
jgi:hypothetical protein